jgi:hypothetical protein
VRSRPTERDQSQAQREATLGVTPHQPVGFERGGQPVRGRARQGSRHHELGEGTGLVLERTEHCHRLVEHSHAAYAAVHNTRL